MKITDLKTYFCSGGPRRTWVFLEVETDEGVIGLGDVTFEGFEATVPHLVDDFKRVVIGLDPMKIEKLWDDVYRKKYWRQDMLVGTVLSGIEMACWDIKGKALGVPCYELFGGAVRDKVECYGNYWFMKTKMGPTTVSEYAESAAKAVEKGWTALKWSPFGYASRYYANPADEATTVECVKRVREAVGPDVRLLVDAHGRFNLPQSKRLARRFEPYDLFFFEEPMGPESIQAFVELKHASKTPIATGERLWARYQFRDLLSAYAVDYIQPDLIHTGGMAEMLKIAQMAEAYFIPVVPHNPLSPVGTCASVHVCACMPNFQILEYIPVPSRDEILVEPFVPENGFFKLPTKPGLGIELNHKEIAKYPYHPTELDHFLPVREIINK